MKGSGAGLSPAAAVKLVRAAALMASIALGLCILGFGGSILLANSNGKVSLAEAAQLQKEAEEVRGVLAKAKTEPADQDEVLTQSKAVAQFQAAATALAVSKGCGLNEFLASTDAQPYLCRFVKQGQTEGWLQIETQLLLIGASRAVLETIGELADQSVPIEFSAIQITREKIGLQGATVKAKVQLRILIQAPGAAS